MTRNDFEDDEFSNIVQLLNDTTDEYLRDTRKKIQIPMTADEVPLDSITPITNVNKCNEINNNTKADEKLRSKSTEFLHWLNQQPNYGTNEFTIDESQTKYWSNVLQIQESEVKNISTTDPKVKISKNIFLILFLI